MLKTRCADNKRLDEWVEKEAMDFTQVKRPEDQKDKKKEQGTKKRKKKKKKVADGDGADADDGKFMW